MMKTIAILLSGMLICLEAPGLAQSHSNIEPSAPISTSFALPIGEREGVVATDDLNDSDGWGVVSGLGDTYQRAYHLGQDWNFYSSDPTDADPRDDDLGKPVYAASSGTVVFAGFNIPPSGKKGNGYGNMVVLQHRLQDGQKIYTLYAHLDEIEPGIREGAIVNSTKSPIGKVGNTGFAPSPHLHFELFEGDWKLAVAEYGYVTSALSGVASHTQVYPEGKVTWFDPSAFISGMKAPNQSTVRTQIDEYEDKFVSSTTSQYVVSAARKRDYPTTLGSTVLSTLLPGSELNGRWVRGGDGESLWLKTEDGGYVWEGNLADAYGWPDIPPLIVAGQNCQGEMCFKYIEAGMKAIRTVDVFDEIGSSRVIGQVEEGTTQKPADYRILLRRLGRATVSCNTMVIYGLLGAPTSVKVSKGTGVTLLYYFGEGNYVGTINGRGAGEWFQVEDLCLKVSTEVDAQDWLKVRTSAGNLGWVPLENFTSVEW